MAIYYIRKAKPVDRLLIAKIYSKSFGDKQAIIAVDNLLKTMGSWAYIVEFNQSKSSQLIAAGFIIARSIIDETEILSIGVDSNFLRFGIAEKLMQQAIIEAKFRNGDNIFLEVAENNNPARRLYKKLGFDMIGKRKGYYLSDGKRIDALNLKLKLNMSN